MNRTTLNQWEILNAVVEYGGYNQAAEFLHRSHSSLHHAVMKLQDQLGVEIIQVDGRKTSLTAAGEVLHRRSRQILQDMKDLEGYADILDMGWETELTIGIEAAFPKSIIMKVLEQFYPISKGTRLKIKDVVLTGAEEMIKDKVANLVISPLGPAGYTATPLMTVHFHPYAHPDHALFSHESEIDSKTLEHQLQIVISDKARKQRTDRGWLKAEERWTVDNFDMAMEVISNGLGFCWLPEHVAKRQLEDGRLKMLTGAQSLNRAVLLSLYVPDPNKQGPAAKKLFDLIKKEANTAASF